MNQKPSRKILLFKKRVQKLVEGRDYSSQPILGLDAIRGRSGFYKINPQEVFILNDIFSRFVALGGNFDKLLGYCRRRKYTTKIQSYQCSRKLVSKKTGGNHVPRLSLELLTNTKIFGYGSIIDHDDVFSDLQKEGKRLVLPLAHGCVIDPP